MLQLKRYLKTWVHAGFTLQINIKVSNRAHQLVVFILCKYFSNALIIFYILKYGKKNVSAFYFTAYIMNIVTFLFVSNADNIILKKEIQGHKGRITNV